MKPLPAGLVALAAILVCVPFLAPSPAEAAASAPMRFGMDANSVAAQSAAGVAPDYGTFWLGPWTLKSGWGGPDSQMQSMVNAGVTPAIHFYYWGDDISQSCLTNGCWSSLHNAQKDQAGWDLLTEQTIAHLDAKMQGKPVLIFLESEFNKADVQTWEPLDAMLAEKAAELKAGYPAAQVVMSLGSWNTPAWKTWDRIAAASDLVGIQGMRGSTKDSLAHYQDLYETTVANAQKLQALFGKPVVLQDIALSSHPEPDYLPRQAAELQQFFDNMPALKAAGVQAMLYRTWRDNPNMNTANYYGEAERHWGLTAATYDKPAKAVWVDGVKAERAAGADHPPVARIAATPDGMTVDVDASQSSDLDGDAMAFSWAFGDGATATGPTASHTYATPGTYTITLTATTDGAAATATQAIAAVQPDRAPVAGLSTRMDGLALRADGSGSSDADGDAMAFAWSFGDGATATGALASHAYAAPGTYTVQLTVTANGASDVATATVTAVQPNRAPSAAFAFGASGLTAALDASASKDPDGDALSYSWSFGDGTAGTGTKASRTYATSGTYTVTLTVSDGALTSVAKQQVTVKAPFAATFAHKGNEWWVEAKVTANAPLAKVEAKVGSGAWTQLPLTSWGNYAKSIHAPAGSQVTFRATDASGAISQASPVTWLAQPEPDGPVLTATFAPKQTTNNYWVETRVTASAPVTVDVRVNGGSWQAMKATDWGTFAKGMHVPEGSQVQFRAVDATGAQVLSARFTWT